MIWICSAPEGMTPEAWAAWAQAIVSVVSACIAIWAAIIMKRTAAMEKTRDTFDLMREVSLAHKNFATEGKFGDMTAIMREWEVGQPIGPRQVLVKDFFDALETLIIAIESNAADEQVADRMLAHLVAHPEEIRATIAVAREKMPPETWDHVEQYFDRRSPKDKKVP